jgi:hypothetical protein
MIAEIAVGQSKSSASLIDTMGDIDFVVNTAKRINAVPLRELELRLPEFVKMRSRNAFVLGGVLERIRREKFWNPGSRHANNALFERWVEETCHYSGRRARYLISVYTGLVQAAMPESQVSGIGWSKLRLIAPLLKPVNSGDTEALEANRAYNDELVALARGKSRKALEAALKSRSVTGEVADAETERQPRHYVFTVQQDEAGAVDAALAKIADETGLTGGAALVHMATLINASAADARARQVLN